MATRYEALSGAFKERVLPHFPNAKERFERHFKPSCELISLFRGTKGQTPYLSLDFAQVVLGIKPLATDIAFDGMDRGAVFGAIRAAGLGVVVRKIGYAPVDVYDPALVSGPLSRLLNRRVPPESVQGALEGMRDSSWVFPEYACNHEILGYSEKLGSALPNHHLRVTSLSLKYTSISVFGFNNASSLEPSLAARAAAAALVEDIRGSPTQIVSSAAIVSAGSGLLEIQDKVAVVRRSGRPGEWSLDEGSNMPAFSVLLPSKAFRAMAFATGLYGSCASQEGL